MRTRRINRAVVILSGEEISTIGSTSDVSIFVISYRFLTHTVQNTSNKNIELNVLSF